MNVTLPVGSLTQRQSASAGRMRIEKLKHYARRCQIGGEMSKRTYKATVLIANIDPEEYPQYFADNAVPENAVFELIYAKPHDIFPYCLLSVEEEA